MVFHPARHPHLVPEQIRVHAQQHISSDLVFIFLRHFIPQVIDVVDKQDSRNPVLSAVRRYAINSKFTITFRTVTRKQANANLIVKRKRNEK